MCNEHRLRKSLEQVREAFRWVEVPFWAEGGSNMQPRDSIRITERSPVVRPFEGGGRLQEMRWSWPGPGGKPVYNFRSEGRDFPRNLRCLVLTDGFFEFTDPEPGAKRKSKWLFTLGEERLFAIAGVMRRWEDAATFSMLTTEPGPDVAPYHHRSVAVLPLDRWAAWLAGEPEGRLLEPPPLGTLSVTRVG